MQRETIYRWRRTLVTGEGYDAEDLIGELIDDLCEQHAEPEVLAEALRAHFGVDFELPPGDARDRAEAAFDQALDLLQSREEHFGREELREIGRLLLLQSIDELWTDHLSALERLEHGIGLRGYAQVDPVIEWRKEATELWQELLMQIRSRAVTLWFALR